MNLYENIYNVGKKKSFALGRELDFSLEKCGLNSDYIQNEMAHSKP